MTLNALYPVLAVDDVAAVSRFFLDHFPFETTFEADWYVSLRTTGEPCFQLAVMAHDHPSVPEEYRLASQGVLINLEISDADAEYGRLRKAGVDIVHDIRSEEWGQRHFIAAGPGKILVDVIQPVPPSEAFLAQYAEDARGELFDGDGGGPDSGQ